MNVQNISEVIIAVVVAIIGAVTPYLAKFIKSNKTAQTLVDILPTLAKDAVVAMQKLGVSDYLEGAAKKSGAVKTVETALEKLGFNETDEVTIANAVESAYASLVADGTLAPYKQATAEAEEKTDKFKAARLAIAAAYRQAADAVQAGDTVMASSAADKAASMEASLASDSEVSKVTSSETSIQSPVADQTNDNAANPAAITSNVDVK